MKAKNLLLVIALATSSAFAEIKMPALFSDNMMFQSNAPIKIWGTADANAEVRIDFANQSKTVKACANGNWRAELSAEKGSFVPRDIRISENGKVAKEISNVLVGQVWIAGGQSNMEFPVKYTFDFERAKKTVPNYAKKLRYFFQTSEAYTRTPQSDFFAGSRWEAPTAQNVGEMAAAAFYFAEKLSDNIDEPVGIIYASKGATGMACWTSKEFLQKADFARPALEQFEKELASYTPEDYQKKLAKFKEFMKKYRAAKASKTPLAVPWDATIPPNPIAPRYSFRCPYMHYNGAIYPMRDFSVKGVVWYQGESDAGNKAKYFIEKFSLMIDCWRSQFKNPDLVFIFSELAAFNASEDWAYARVAQAKSAKVIDKCYMSAQVDSGEKDDIHPRDKTIVGRRMADIALSKVYGNNSFFGDAPELASVSFDDAKAMLVINTYKRGIYPKGELRGFEVLVDGKWQPAKAIFTTKKNTAKSFKGTKTKNWGSANRISVEGKNGGKVDGVRYLWKGWTMPDACVFNKDGLPLLPFQKTR